MIVLLLCVIMKIAEFSVGRMSPPFQTPARPPHLYYGKQKRNERKYYRRPNETCHCLVYNPARAFALYVICNVILVKKRNMFNKPEKYFVYARYGAGKGAAMMEDPQTPGSDCNSNPAIDSIQHDLISSEFVQDNVEYQWFIDYGYRDGGLHVHPSVLSSLSASYSREDLGYYDDLARNLDANLAEIDMESFRTADIHTLLTALPVMCTDPVQHSEFNYQRERYASISGSVMEKLDIGSSISPHTSSQGEDSACSTTDTISICKSSLLFSPLKETPILPPGGSYSVDSLDCEDMLLTCQTNNKDNYTIAFEGSITMYSDGSQDFENQEKQQKAYETAEPYYNRNADLKNVLDLSMACSDSKIYTTWSNLKHSSMNKIITRHPSGNNNTIPEFSHGVENIISAPNKRSQSLPDLTQARQLHVNMPLNFSVDSAESNNHVQQLHSSGSVMSRSINEESSDNGEHNSTGKKLQNLSLVKLFMKQKSMSAEGMSLTLDQSDSVSDNGWPTNNSASDSGTNTNTQIQRQNINNISKRQVPEGDFSINWVKSDQHNNQDTENQKDSFNDIPKYTSTISEQKDEMMSSASIEELSENMSKSDLTHGNDVEENDIDVIPNVFEHQRKAAWIKSLEKKYPICKTTGIQAIAETEDNSVQTSLVYTPPVKEKENPSLKETIVNKKPVYVVYPNYALPDLSFLNIKDTKLDNVALKPQCFGKNRVSWKHTGRSGRPFSCNDIDTLRQRGFSHVKDWESLTFLLPAEYKKILHDVPEVSKHINIHEEMKKPLFCLSPPMRHKTRTISEIIPNNSSSTSSTATQPSSGYRGSSTILTDSSTNQQTLNAANPLYLYRYDSISSEASLVSNDKKMHRQIMPPRPPLPRSILRKSKVPTNKRYSMFEMGDVEEIEDQSRKMSMRRKKNIIENSEDDVKQLEEFLKRSGFSSQSSDGDTEDPDVKLRSYVRKFLALRMNKDVTKVTDMIESQKKTVSFAVNQRKKYLDNKVNLNIATNEQEKDPAFTEERRAMSPDNKLDLDEKRKMILSVNKAADLLLKYWNSESIHSRQNYNDKNECAQICISNLCPALYTIMSDGLKSHLSSTFGPIANSVWQVVEASSQQGPVTKTLNELVQKINGDDVITEGMLKFHAFVFGLLNLRALDAWFAYLCTRESILRKHYNSNSLFVAALANANAREVVDALLHVLNPLAFCPFQLDLLYQYRQLHNSFGSLHNHTINAVNFRNIDAKEHHFDKTDTCVMVSSPRKVRPRSCVAYNNYDEKPGGIHKSDMETIKKRLSNPIGSKIFRALDKLASEDSEDYTDSLEHSPLNRASNKQPVSRKSHNSENKMDDEDNMSGEEKFRKLQEKWELMVGKEDAKIQPTISSPLSPIRTPTGVGKSKIPRLLTSPVKQSNTISVKNTKSPISGIPSLKKPVMLSTTKTTPKKPIDVRNKDTTKRTSRVDQEIIGTTRTHLTRPSSLPYKSYGIMSKDKHLVSPQRRAASTSLPRPTTTNTTRNHPTKKPLK
ncbi:Iporin [Melipona quadrifasciata]|uniref:Iporin n=1 Tax=Melipona quadrifasciata TaxID=166423 RepID=A0A0M8ZN39_9HYME|nr:Iporin [Melipona quadrifasciata]